MAENSPHRTGSKQRRLRRAEAEVPQLPPGRAIEQINVALSAESSPKGFLPDAENTLLAAGDDYMGLLGVEAIRIAEYRHATAVDRPDVLAATKNSAEAKIPENKAGFWLSQDSQADPARLLSLQYYWRPNQFTMLVCGWISIAALGSMAVVMFIASYPWNKKG